MIAGALGLAAVAVSSLVDAARAQLTPATTLQAPTVPAKPKAPPATLSKPAPATGAPATAPTVSLEVVPDRDGVERQETLPVVVIVTNKSDTPLTGVKLSVPGSLLKPVGGPDINVAADIAPFETVHKSVVLTPDSQAAFGAHKVPLVVQYAWSSQAGTRISAQTATLGVTIKRRFEEEARGLPGGTAVFLYLLLPVVPVFLGYDVVDRLRRGEPLRLPSFGTEHILPGFLLALLLSLVFLTISRFNVELAYTNPGLFLGVLGLAALAGATVPAIRWLYAASVRRRWAFRNDDVDGKYLRKALLAPGAPSRYQWVVGTVGGEAVEGVRLQQPDGKLVLGARLQVNVATGPDGKPREAEWRTLTTQVFASGSLKDRKRLVEMVETGQVAISVLQRVIRGGQAIDGQVSVERLGDFKETTSTQKALVETVR